MGQNCSKKYIEIKKCSDHAAGLELPNNTIRDGSFKFERSTFFIHPVVWMYTHAIYRRCNLLYFNLIAET